MPFDLIPEALVALRSPFCQAPLPNCTTPTETRPMRAHRRPKAAVDLLCLTGFNNEQAFLDRSCPATSASLTALRVAIFRLVARVLVGFAVHGAKFASAISE